MKVIGQLAVCNFARLGKEIVQALLGALAAALDGLRRYPVLQRLAREKRGASAGSF